MFHLKDCSTFICIGLFILQIINADAFHTIGTGCAKSIVRNSRYGATRPTIQPAFYYESLTKPIPTHGMNNDAKLIQSDSSTSLYMGYNLPPSGGGGGGNKIQEIISPVLTIAAVVLFFLSPLGGIFFAITNSIFLVALITPFLITVGFKVWETFYTIEAPCPNCEFPVRVLKDEEAQPSYCLNCGSLVRANREKDGVELCNNPNDMFENSGGFGSLFDSLFTTETVIEEESSSPFSRDSSSMNTGGQSRKDKAKRERTVIDVDVEDD